ncbi:MAG: DUF1156 domain-containing protein [Oscillospiraceae bacterium]|nr:DUF1156 domain-containing protein [Oscillospiraceae bacterium]
MPIKKLIEVALPLEKINEQAAREKSIRHGHPSTLHLWWARRPLAAARAVIWASLVDDPSSHPEQFPTEEEQEKERKRLFNILERLVVWENSNDEDILAESKAEIMKSTGGNPPALLDPFAGGGAIPLEAQRLGLEAHAHDLNPVAVMINKAMIEIPPRFAGKPPVNPDDRGKFGMNTYKGAAGLAADVKYYGELMKKKAFEKIGHLYPEVKDENGVPHTVIAWIWARTVKCPNPACGCQMPLVKSFDLSTKKNHEYHADYSVKGNKLIFKAEQGKSNKTGTIGRKGATCPVCDSPVDFPYIRNCGQEGKMSAQLMAIVAEGGNGRIYLSPNEIHENCANVEKPDEVPNAALPYNPRNFNTPNYGLTGFADLFTNRQLTTLTSFSDLLTDIAEQVTKDTLATGTPDDNIPLEDGGSGALAYAQAVCVYLAFVIDKLSDYNSSSCSWHSSGEKLRNTFGRQAIPMVWDYTEANPFCNSTGSYNNMLEWVVKCVTNFKSPAQGYVRQFDAQSDCELRNIMISTDPPYYDNISYADLSDFFYVWLRNSLKTIYPKVFRTMLVPKTEELVATQYRFDSAETARSFFESGMLSACKQMYIYARDDIPVTIYYAYKQSETDEESSQTASTGWETMLSAIINAGFSITGTWPMRTEMATRTIGMGTNALASSIVLVCRKRPQDASQITRRNFINELKRELRPALKKLQSSNIAPVDLAQSAIGPGMGVFSKYKAVLEADGTPMSVRAALAVINSELDIFFNEQDGELDRESRFCVDLFTQKGFDTIDFGTADTLARAKNTSVNKIAATGALYAQKGEVHLVDRKDLPEKPNESMTWLFTQQLTYAMEKGGIDASAEVAAKALTGLQQAKDLIYRLYQLCERKGWTNEAYAYNNLIVSWNDIIQKANDLKNAGLVEDDDQQKFDGI